MKEYFDGLIQALGKVPTEFAVMSETQKLILSIIVGLLAATWTYNTTIWYLKRRASKVPFEKPDPKADLEQAEAWHDDVFNKFQNKVYTEKQYKRYVRFLKTLHPDVMWGGPYSGRVRKIIGERRLMYRIAQRINTGLNLPTLGWKIFEKKVRELSSPVKRGRFTRTKL